MKIPVLTSLLTSVFVVCSSAATTLVSDTFESSLGNWTGSVDAALYSFTSGTNYATTGTGAASLNTGGFNGANPLTLTTALQLATLGATSVTIDFDIKWDGGNGTRFFNPQYSTNGGSSWTNWGGSITAPTTAAYSRTLSAGLTDEFLIRFLPKNDGSNIKAYFDNVVISAEGVTIPEPSTALLGGIGFLLLLRRRRA